LPAKKTLKLLACTDAGNAELFAKLYHGKLQFDHRRKHWFVWCEHWWVEDADGRVLRMAKRAARVRLGGSASITDSNERSSQAKWALKSESRYALQSALTLAEAESSLAYDGTGWDADPWLLGVGNGVVDLRTGVLRDGRPSDRIVLHTPIPFAPLALCLRWMQFLNEIFLGDAELIAFIQRAVGYSLSGDSSEQCLFLCYGAGANGKSTFLETVRQVAGGYGWNLPFSAFELQNRASIPNDVASLAGKRLVTAIETNESVRLNEARVKALTGMDTITARMLYREFFSFQPVAKVWLAFNHKPQVADESHGFWRRIRLVPFLAQFHDAAVDKQLMAKLLVEAPGILAWAVQGCLEWQRSGLGMPAAVAKATDEYREQSDPLADFVSECCVLAPQAQVPAGAIWEAYLSWAQWTGEKPLDRRAFAHCLESLGCHHDRDGHGRTRTWVGICRRKDASTQSVPAAADVRTDADVKLQ
jgi:putative DNA primase/helicase